MDDKGLERYKPSGYPTVIFLDADGKEIAKLGDRSPAAVARQIEDIAAKYTRGPKWLTDADAAVAAGKSESKPVALVFVDDKPKSAAFLQIFADPTMMEEMEKVVFARIEFKKDSEEAKRWKVAQGATLVILDVTGDEPKVVKTLTGVGAKAVKTALEDQIKKAMKK